MPTPFPDPDDLTDAAATLAWGAASDAAAFLADVPRHRPSAGPAEGPEAAAARSREALAGRKGMEWLDTCETVLLAPRSSGLGAQLRQLHALVRVLRDGAVPCPATAFPRNPGYVPAPVLALRLVVSGRDLRTRYDHDGQLAPGARLAGLAIARSATEAVYLPIGHAAVPDVPNWRPEAVARCLGYLHEQFLCLYHHAGEQLEAAALNGVAGFRSFPYLLDTEVLDFLHDVNDRRHGLAACAARHLARTLPPMPPRPHAAPAAGTLVAACSEAMSAYGLFEAFLGKPEAENVFLQQPIPLSIDQHLVHAIREMCRPGLPVNIAYLTTAAKDAIHRLQTIEHEIHRLAGGPFNAGSPAQLNEVLFRRCAIPPLPDHPAGAAGLLSTDEGCLKRLAALHPEHAILGHVIAYRRLLGGVSGFFLKALANAYTCALLPFARVQLAFDQCSTPSGRLSSAPTSGRERVSIRQDEARAARPWAAPPSRARYDPGDWRCGFNCQGIPAAPLRTAPARRLRALPAAAGVDPAAPYPAAVEHAFLKGLAAL